MPVAGIDISDEIIRFVTIKETPKGLEIDEFGEYVLPKGTIRNGEIQNSKVLHKYLLTLKKEHGIHFARVSLPEEKAYVIRLQIPQMSRKEIRGSIELQFEEQVPIPVSEAVFDYDIIKETDKEIEISLFALPRETSESHLEVFSGTGITPLEFEIESEAIARAVVSEGDKGTFMIVDFERTKTGISIISEQAVRFTSSLQIGGNALIEAAAEQLKISSKEAEDIVQEKGVSVERKKEEKDEEIFMSLIPVLSTLRDEINKHYIYWQTHNDQYGKPHPKIEKLILCGEGAMVSGIADYLSAGMRTTVSLADTMMNIRSSEMYIPEMEYTESFKYVTAIGLALPHTHH